MELKYHSFFSFSFWSFLSSLDRVGQTFSISPTNLMCILYRTYHLYLTHWFTCLSPTWTLKLLCTFNTVVGPQGVLVKWTDAVSCLIFLCSVQHPLDLSSLSYYWPRQTKADLQGIAQASMTHQCGIPKESLRLGRYLEISSKRESPPRGRHFLAPSDEGSLSVCTQFAKVQTLIHPQNAIAFKEPSFKTYFKNPNRCHHQAVNNSNKTF